MEKTRTIEIQGKLARASCLPNGRRAHAHRLVEAEAGGGVGEDVGVDGVRDVRLPVGNGALLGGETLEDAAEPREMERRQCLSSLIFSSSRSPDSARPRVEAATGGHVTDGELVEGGVGEAGAVRLGEADEDDLDGEDGPEGGVAGALGGEGRGRRRGTCPRPRCSRRGCTGCPR